MSIMMHIFRFNSISILILYDPTLLNRSTSDRGWVQSHFTVNYIRNLSPSGQPHLHTSTCTRADWCGFRVELKTLADRSSVHCHLMAHSNKWTLKEISQKGHCNTVWYNFKIYLTNVLANVIKVKIY